MIGKIYKTTSKIGHEIYYDFNFFTGIQKI